MPHTFRNRCPYTTGYRQINMASSSALGFEIRPVSTDSLPPRTGLGSALPRLWASSTHLRSSCRGGPGRIERFFKEESIVSPVLLASKGVVSKPH